MNQKIHILMIEDDPVLAELLTNYLINCNITVEVNSDPTTVLQQLQDEHFDLIILDLTLPKMDGLFLCEKISNSFDTPIIISSARDQVSDKVLGLEKGADDYLPKPYDPRELEARIHSVLRRYEAKSQEKQESKSDFKCDTSSMVITYKNRNIDLTNAEFGILSYMISKQGLVVSREDLIHNVNAINEDSSNKSIDVMVGRIRNKLGDKSLIESVRGVGYKLLK